MSREISTAVGVGVLGLGLSYIGYKIFTSGSSVAKQKSKPVALQREDTCFGTNCIATYENIQSDSGNDHIEADIHNQNENGDLESTKIDIFILYSTNDFKKARTFQQNICKYVSTPDLNVVLMDDVGIGMPIFQAFKHGLQSSTFTFVLVTEFFIKDKLKKFLAGTGLIADLQSSDTIWRLGPVWVDTGINETDKCPFELSSLHGLHYNRFLDGESDAQCFDKIDKLLKEGRKKEMEKVKKRELENGD